MTLKPAYKLTIGSPSDNGGGLGAALTNVDTSLVSGSGKLIDTTDEPKASTIVDLTVSLDMDTPADSFTLVMGQVGTFRPERGGATKIELGYNADDELTQVMAGTVAHVEPGLTTRRVVGYSAADALLRTFSGETFENKSAGQIIRDLADKASVEVDTASNGIQFPAYVVDGQRSLYRHMRDIADLCGFDLYINNEGKLVFERFTGGNIIHVFEFAKHILQLEILENAPQAEAVEGWGESPGGSQSQDDWAWLTKDFASLKGSAGEGSSTLLLERPVLRSSNAAQSAADALSSRIQRRKTRGNLLILGRPSVKLGDAIRLREVPEDSLNAVYQVRSVVHRITKQGGFTTQIGFWGTD